MAITPKNQIDISNGGLAIEFFMYKCLTGSREVVGGVVREILTIIMLTPTLDWTWVWGSAK